VTLIRSAKIAVKATIGLHVAAIAVMHGLDVEGELAEVLPALSKKDDD